MTGLELILTGLCIAALAWATVCHVWMVEAQREEEVYRQEAQRLSRNLHFCYNRLYKQRKALKGGICRVAKREQAEQKNVDDLVNYVKTLDSDLAEMDDALHDALDREERLQRQCRALSHGVLVKGDHEQAALHEAHQWVRKYIACNEQAGDEFYRGYQAHKRQVADDLLGLAERYEEAARQ